MNNTLDATGYNPMDIKLVGDEFRICKVVAITVGNNEYETKLRWHLPKNKKDRRMIAQFKNTLGN